MRVFAPAKINLYLHVTGQREDGYHTLNSVAVFADIGDDLTLTEADDFKFTIDGPFADRFSPSDRDYSNLVIFAARSYALLKKRDELRCHITLTKNLPLAAGLGGGTSDAAAVLRGLAQMWGVEGGFPRGFLVAIGADMPLCMAARPMRVRGIGERLEPVNDLPKMPVVLVNPGQPCPTPDVFKRCRNFSGEAKGGWRGQANDLQAAAIEIVPEIATVLSALDETGADLSRMSGSGATCFGIFGDSAAAQQAAQQIAAAYPAWWVRAGTLNP